MDVNLGVESGVGLERSENENFNPLLYCMDDNYFSLENHQLLSLDIILQRYFILRLG
jgi:hypothetical protein